MGGLFWGANIGGALARVKDLYWAAPYDFGATLAAAIARGGAAAQHDMFTVGPTATVLGNGRFAASFGTSSAIGAAQFNHTYPIDATAAQPGAFPSQFQVQALAITVAATANPADLGVGNGWKTLCGIGFDDGDSMLTLGFATLTTLAPGFGVVAQHDGVTGLGAWVLQYFNPGRPLQAPNRTVLLDDTLYPATIPTRFMWLFTNAVIGQYSTLQVYANGALVDAVSWNPGAPYTMPNYRTGKRGVWVPWIFGDKSPGGVLGASSIVIADCNQYYGPLTGSIVIE